MESEVLREARMTFIAAHFTANDCWFSRSFLGESPGANFSRVPNLMLLHHCQGTFVE
jgi:hypothetical protein